MKNVNDTGRGSGGRAASVVYLTETELAERWRLSVKTLQNWRVAGGGVAFVKGRRFVRYPLSAIQAWEADHTYRNTSGRCW